jgi:hypothetical protein
MPPGVVTDELSMALMISGGLKKSREVHEAAIAKDPRTRGTTAISAELMQSRIILRRAKPGSLALDRRTHTLNGKPFPGPEKTIL